MSFERKPWETDQAKPALAPSSDGASTVWLAAAAARVLGSAVFGGVLFGLFLGPWLLMSLPLGEWGKNRWTWVFVGVAAGSVLGLLNAWRRYHKRRKTQLLAASLSLEYADSGSEAAAERLKTILARNGFVSLENVMVGRRDGARMLVGDLVHRSTGSENNSRRVRTVACFEELDVTLPRFSLRPEGMMLNLLTSMVGVQDIDFDGHPEFSRRYHLTGESPETVRQLFQPELLDYLTDMPLRELRGEGDCLVVVSPGRSVKADQLEAFVDQAMELRRRFEKQAAAISGMAPPVHQDRPKFSGPIGRLAQQGLLTDDEIRRFLEMPTPRDVPRKLLYQHLHGSAWFLIIFFGVWIAFSGIFTLIGAAMAELIPLAIGGAFLLIGAGVLAWILWSRRRKFRMLERGRLASGRIEAVERTNVAINNQQRYLLRISYIADGRPELATVPIYGGHVELARAAADADEPVPLLFDPNDPRRVLLGLQLVNDFPLRT